MHWPAMEEITGTLDLPPGFRMRQMARGDILAVAGALEAWFPDLAAGRERALLMPDFHAAQVALAGEERDTEKRPVFVALLEEGTTIAACLVLEHLARWDSIIARVGAVGPTFRGRGLGAALAAAWTRIGVAVSARLLYGFTELDNRAACKDFERAGFRLAGILPDSDRTPMGLSHRFVPEAIFVKTLIAPEEMSWPEPAALRPRTAALMKLLYDHGDIQVPDPPEPLELPPVASFDPELAAHLDQRPGGRGTWPDIGLIAGQLALPPGVVVRQLARADVPRVIGLLPEWFPELVEGYQRYMLSSEFYDHEVALAGEEARVEERPGFAYLVEVDGEPAVFSQLTCDLSRSTLRAEIAVIAPSHRRRNFSTQLTPLSALLARALGMETILGWATLKHPYAQLACERHGWRLIACVPASDRQAVAPGVVKHVFEAIYAASLVPPELSTRPPPSAMSPQMAAVARFVLG